MRHGKHRAKLGRTVSHRRCMVANMVKSLIENGRVTTTVQKAKEVRRHAERAVTLAKQGSLAARRRVIADLMVRYNRLDPKQARAARSGDTYAYNRDRIVVGKLFSEMPERYAERQGGYTRIIRTDTRKGDGAEMAILEWV